MVFMGEKQSTERYLLEGIPLCVLAFFARVRDFQTDSYRLNLMLLENESAKRNRVFRKDPSLITI